MKFAPIILIILAITFASCSDDTVTYIEGGNADYLVEYAIIDPTAWQPVSLDDPFSWTVAHLIKSPASHNIGEKGAVFCYYRKPGISSWEMMPSTAVYWTEEGTVYSEEYWFAYDNNYVDFYYRYTEPDVNSRPISRIEVKIVMLEGEYLQQLDLNDKLIELEHDELMRAINRADKRENTKMMN